MSDREPDFMADWERGAASDREPRSTFDAPVADRTSEAAVAVPGSGVAGRRTVTIHGRPAERYSSTAQRRRPTRRPHEREGFRPDRVAMWAVMLGFVLVLVAATSSHAAVLTHHTGATTIHHVSAAALTQPAPAAHRQARFQHPR